MIRYNTQFKNCDAGGLDLRSLIVMVLVLSSMLCLSAAWAAKPSIVTKINGEAYVLRSDPSSSWLATWSAQADGKFTLMVIDGEKGDRREVVTVDNPGGLCWIPSLNRLLYCKGVYNDKLKNNNVVYYYYDIATAKSTKITDIVDALDTYQLDPIAAEDGSMVFLLTIDTRRVPSFNIYFPDANTLSRTPVDANIGSEYDLSSDGSKLFWYLRNPADESLNVIGWDFAANAYSDLFEFGAARDPADDHALFKVDSPHMQAATAVASETDPTLQLCVYSYKNSQNLGIVPIRLPAGEEVMYFDWKGRTGLLYALTKNTKSGEYCIIEIEPLEGKRIELLRGRDEITLVDYSPKTQTYFYSVVDSRNPSKPLTALIRLR